MKRAIVERGRHFLIFASQSHLLYYLILFEALSYLRWLNEPVIGSLIGIMLVDSFYAWERQFQRAEEMTKGSVVNQEKRAFVRTSDSVLALYKRNGYGVLAQANQYFGKWIRVSGIFDGATGSLSDETVHVSLLLSDGQRINLHFSAERHSEISCLVNGQAITAVSRIEPVPNYGGGYFVFAGSEILSVKPRRSYVLQSA
jgi:hypothetical protein